MWSTHWISIFSRRQAKDEKGQTWRRPQLRSAAHLQSLTLRSKIYLSPTLSLRSSNLEIVLDWWSMLYMPRVSICVTNKFKWIWMMGAAVQRCLCSYRFLSIKSITRASRRSVTRGPERLACDTADFLQQKWESRPEKSFKNTRALGCEDLRRPWMILQSFQWLTFFIQVSHINAPNDLMHLLILVYHCLQIDHFSPQEAHRTAKVGRMQCLQSRFHSAPSVP